VFTYACPIFTGEAIPSIDKSESGYPYSGTAIVSNPRRIPKNPVSMRFAQGNLLTN
jgi:hypothetical protein